jgi:hypothetical protein
MILDREANVDEVNFNAAVGRLRRKIDVLRLESKARNEPRVGNYAEMLTLLDIIERAARKEMSDGNETG